MADSNLGLTLSEAAARLGENSEQELARAHVEGKATLTGRCRRSSGVANRRDDIPARALLGFGSSVRFNLETNSIEANAGAEYADFEREVGCGWEDVKVASHEVAALAKSLNGRKGATANAETACLRWLCAKMTANPDCPDSKESCYVEAQDEFGVGVRAFDRVWRQAINETGADAWSRPGPRSRGKDRA